MDISVGVSGTLRAQMDGHPPCVLAAGFCKETSAQSRGIGYEEERAPTLRAGVVPATVYENHSQSARYTGPLDTAPTVGSTYGTGGNNQPFVVETDTPKTPFALFCKGTRPHSAQEGQVWKPAKVANTLNTFDVGESRCAELAVQAYNICIKGGSSPRSRCNEVDISRALDCGAGGPVSNQGGTAVVERPTYAVTTGSYTQVSEEQAPTLMARDFKDPAAVNRGYSVRRLTPTECARLQGFPDFWCADLDTPEPTEEDISFWTEVWETHRRVMGRSSRPKSRNQIVKWLRHPHSDAAEYAMWGNGVALPNVFFVLAGIVWAAQLSGQ